MTSEPASVKPEELLAEQDFVRRLAYRLVFDKNRAEDALQDAWVAALRHPPREATAVRAWFARVIQNSASRVASTEHRRLEREREAATTEPLPSPADVVAREEERKSVVDAVLALPEPYRGAVLARYFDGVSPSEFAQRRGVPAATVRSHLARGLEMLRCQLDRRHGGDRRVWLAALLPLTRRATPVGASGVGAAAAAVLGGSVMKLMVVGSIVAAAMVFAVSFVGDRGQTEPEEGGAVVLHGPRPLHAQPEAPRVALAADERATIRRVVQLRLVVVDRARRESSLSGEVRIALVGANDRDERRLKIVRGLGSVEVGDATRALQLLGGRMRDRVVLRQVAEVELPRDAAEVELECAWAPYREVHVVDAATGVHLDGVVALHRVFEFPGLTPFDERAVAGRGGSPMFLPVKWPERSQSTFFFWAPGRAWELVDVPNTNVHPHLVHLDPGGSLAVRVDGTGASDARLQVCRADQRHPMGGGPLPVGECELPRRGETVRCEGLRPGPYAVRLLAGNPGAARVLSDVNVVVTAGATAAVELGWVDAVPRPAPELVEVVGALEAPGWSTDQLALTLNPVGMGLGAPHAPVTIAGDELERDRDGSWRWSKRLYEGDYVATVAAGARFRLCVTATGCTGTRMEMGSPVDVKVVFVDADSQRTVQLGGMSWIHTLDAGGGAARMAALSESGSSFRYLGPAGAVSFLGQHDRYGPIREDLELLADQQEAVVVLRARCGVRIAVQGQGEIVPWSADFNARLLREDGSNAVLQDRSFGGEVVAEEPGRYRLDVALPGMYESFSREVSVSAGEFLPVTVDLVRR